jgi:PAS domain-containing protein
MPIGTPATVPNVQAAFGALRSHGDKLAFRPGASFPSSGYRPLGSSHFQGIQRLRTGPFVACTGSSSQAAHLFVVNLATRPAFGRFRSNRLASAMPPTSDRVVSVTAMSTTRTHAGGFQICGDYAAIGLESGGASEVVFYDLSRPTAPSALATTIARPNAGAGAVAMTRLVDGRYLVIAGGHNSNELDFYRSDSTDLTNASFGHLDHWTENELIALGTDSEFGNYQNINLVRQSDGTLFVVGLHRNTNTAPLAIGDDWADLFRLSFDASDQARIEKVAKRHMFCPDGENFDSGAGLFIAGSGHMYLYAVEHYLTNTMVRACEFRPDPNSAPTLSDIQHGWVELYDGAFQGKSLRIDYVDRRLRDYADYSRVEDFGDDPSSAKWRLPAGWQCLLFEHAHYKGRKTVLMGDGSIRRLDLGPIGWDNRVSSSRFVRETIVSDGEAWIELFDDDRFRDRRLSVAGTTGGLFRDYGDITVEGQRGFNDKVSSARWQLPVGRTYRLYQHDGYRGRTLDLHGSGRVEEIADLDDYNFGDECSSSRFV